MLDTLFVGGGVWIFFVWLYGVVVYGRYGLYGLYGLYGVVV